MQRGGLIWVLIGIAKRRKPFLPADLRQRACPCSWTCVKMLQLRGSRCHFLPLVLRMKLWGGIIYRWELDFLEKEELEPGPCCSAHPAAPLQTWGLPGKASRVLPGHSARRPKEPYLPQAPLRIPSGRRQGCLGLGSVYVCVVVCVHKNWHIFTNVAVNGPGAESERMRVVGRTTHARRTCCWAGVQVRKHVF